MKAESPNTDKMEWQIAGICLLLLAVGVFLHRDTEKQIAEGMKAVEECRKSDKPRMVCNRMEENIPHRRVAPP